MKIQEEVWKASMQMESLLYTFRINVLLFSEVMFFLLKRKAIG